MNDRTESNTNPLSPGKSETRCKNSDASSTGELDAAVWNKDDVRSSEERKGKCEEPICKNALYAAKVRGNETTGDLAFWQYFEFKKVYQELPTEVYGSWKREARFLRKRSDMRKMFELVYVGSRIEFYILLEIQTWKRFSKCSPQRKDAMLICNWKNRLVWVDNGVGNKVRYTSCT